MASKRSAICENGKSYLINPNLLFGQGFDDNIFVSPEDLNIYVELTTSKKNRSIIDLTPDDNVEYTSSDVGKKKVSFIDGSPNGKSTIDSNGNKIEGKSLTTSYTELTTVFNKTADTEKFGITSIDIDFNSAYAPLVHIEFVDIRGASLFNTGNPPNSEYSGFFDLPYPIFRLKVKGYYGKTVKYCLHLTKWNARFNTTTGNFEISADFIGYTYAMLSDMLLGYLRAITYTPRGASMFEEAKAEMKNTEELITIKELLDKFVDVNEAITKLQNTDEDVVNLSKNKEISSSIETIENLLMDGMNNIKKSDSSNPEGYALLDNGDGLIGVRNLSGDTEQSLIDSENLKTWKDAMKTVVSELNDSITPESKYNVDDFVGVYAPKYYKDFTYNDIITGTTQTNPTQRIFRTAWVLNDDLKFTTFIDERMKSLSPTNKGVNMTIYDFSKTIKKIDEIKTQINKDEEDIKVNVAEKIRRTFIDTLGFEPTIGSIFRIFTVHAEIFLACLKEVSEKAEGSSLRMTELLGLREHLDVHQSTSTPDGNLPSKIYPWPLFRKASKDTNKNNNFEEAYLGDPNGGVDIPQNVPELVFVDELLDALIKVAKDDAARQERIDNPNTIVNSWFPINVLDTPLFGVIQNPYKTDKIGNTWNTLDPLKLMMMRAFVFLGISNRNPNEPEIKVMGTLEANTCYDGIVNPIVKKGLFDVGKDTSIIVDEIISWFKAGNKDNKPITFKLGDEKIVYDKPRPLFTDFNNRYVYTFLSEKPSAENFLGELNQTAITFNDDFDGAGFFESNKTPTRRSNNEILNESYLKKENGLLFIEPNYYRFGNIQSGSILMKIFSEEQYDDTKGLVPSYIEQLDALNELKASLKGGGGGATEYLDACQLYLVDRNKGLDPPGFNILGDNYSKYAFTTIKNVDISNIGTCKFDESSSSKIPAIPTNNSEPVMSLKALFYTNQPTIWGATSLASTKTSINGALTNPTHFGKGLTANIEYYDTQFPSTAARNLLITDYRKLNEDKFKWQNLGLNRDLFNSEDVYVPFVDFTVVNTSGFDAYNMYSLFGSQWYFEQRRSSSPKAARAFLFLHTFPWNQLYTDDVNTFFDEGLNAAIFDNAEGNTISNIFDRKSAFLNVPYLWAAFIGGILWRFNGSDIIWEDDDNDDADPSGKVPSFKGGSGAYDPIIWGKPFDAQPDSNILSSECYLSDYAYAYTGETIDIDLFPQRNQFFTSWKADAPLQLDTNGKYKFTSRTLRKLPWQVKREFREIFFKFVNSDEWKNIRANYELHPKEWDLPNTGTSPVYDNQGSYGFHYPDKFSSGTNEWKNAFRNAATLSSNSESSPSDGLEIGTTNISGDDSEFLAKSFRGIKKEIVESFPNWQNYEYLHPIRNWGYNDRVFSHNGTRTEIEINYNWDMSFRNNQPNQDLVELFKRGVWIANSSYKSWQSEDAEDYSKFKSGNISTPKAVLNLYLASFVNEWKRIIKLDNEKKEEDELKQQLFNTMDNNTIRLNIYRHCKAIYDKWIAGSQGDVMTSCGQENNSKAKALASLKRKTSKPRLIDSFRFVNRGFNDLSDTYLLNPSAINEIMTGNLNQSFYDLISRVLADNNFNFIALPAYIDFNSKTEMEAMFKPEIISDTLADNISGPTFVCVYVGQSSNKLDLGSGSDFPNDGFDFKCARDTDGKETSQLVASGEGTLPADFIKSGKTHEHNVIAFAVNYGQQNQNIFTDIKLDQQEFAETDESLQITDSIANNGSQSNRTQAGQNLWNVYQVRSYSAQVTAMGNAMIQPMMYFQLNNIPMFHGGYLIINAKHKIEPNFMTTTFKGTRTRYVDTPQVDAKSLYMSMLGTLSDVDGFYKPGSVVRNPTTTVGSSSINQSAIDNSNGLFVRGADGSTYVWNGANGFAGKTLLSFMGDLEKYLQKTHPSKKITLSSNGVTRSIEATIKGGASRSPKSKHGAGLAIDLKFGGIYNGKELGPATGCKKSGLPCYGWYEGNKIVVKDTAIMESIRTFVDTDSKWKNIITWGADFGNEGLAGRVKISGFPNKGEARVDELHHFEIKDGIMAQYIPEDAKTEMTKLGIPIPNKMNDLPALYNYVLKDDVSTKGVDPGNGDNGDGVDDEDKIKQIKDNGLAGTLSNDRVSPLTKEQMKNNLGNI